MTGTKIGGQKAKESNYKKHGKDFYREIGRKGGSQHRPETRMFHVDPELARRAGRIGGLKSKRRKTNDDV